MNYLAHIYLSGNNDQIKVGNFIADFISGNKYKNFDKDIQKGILLHRQIDTYTDAHSIFRQSKKRLFSDFRHYSAVIVDMFYDHFLAKNFSEYSSIPLEEFVTDFYDMMIKHQDGIPPKVKKILPVMIEFNWLASYKDLDQLTIILNQMNNRTKHKPNLHHSIEILKQNYSSFEQEFSLFFADLLREKEKMYISLNID